MLTQKKFKTFLLLFLLFGFFLLISNLQFVCAQENSDNVGGFISNFFDFSNKENLPIFFVKIIFCVVSTLIIGAALSFFKFPPQKILQAFIALGVGFLATVYLTPEEFFLTILSDYKIVSEVISQHTLFGIDLRIILLISLFIIFLIWSNLSKQIKKAKQEAGKIIAEEGIKMAEQIDRASE